MTQEPRHLEMTIKGEFVSPPPEPKIPLGTRVLAWAAAVAAMAAAGVIAVFALWLLMVLIPLALLIALLVYLAFRYQLWRNGGSIQVGTFRWERRR